MNIDCSPEEVTTDDHWFNFCDGLQNSKERECSCRIYAIAAKRHGRWDLSQDELDAVDSMGSFLFNGLDVLDWFEYNSETERWRPTCIYFGRIKT